MIEEDVDSLEPGAIGGVFYEQISGLTAGRATCRGASAASQNVLLSSIIWPQDHNGFSHQDPGFIDIVTNKSSSATRIYLPPDANTLLVVADQCLRSRD
jgi:phosphoketolase